MGVESRVIRPFMVIIEEVTWGWGSHPMPLSS